MIAVKPPPRFNIKIFAITCTIATSSLLSGCDEDMSDLQQYVKERRQAHAGYVDPLPEYELYKGFRYIATDMRDPFGKPQAEANSEAAAQNKKNMPNMNRRQEPLEMFPLDNLRMVGELARNGQSWALIKDSEGVVHRVKEGNYAGHNFGRITSVTESVIEIEETIQDGIGNWITRESQLSLGEE